MAEPTLSLKLLIDTKGKRVLFAETDKDCVDFLFHILSLPVARVTSLLKNDGVMGSLANIYESVENLHESYIQPNQSKDTLLKPIPPTAIRGYSAPLTLLLNDAPTDKKNRKMSQNMSYVAPARGQQASSGEGGFVKGVVTYMVLDDLSVRPLSSISSINLLNKFNVKDVSALEEKDVNLGMNEAVKLLKASLQLKRCTACNGYREKQPGLLTVLIIRRKTHLRGRPALGNIMLHRLQKGSLPLTFFAASTVSLPVSFSAPSKDVILETTLSNPKNRNANGCRYVKESEEAIEPYFEATDELASLEAFSAPRQTIFS
ncbi:hypothetical protein BUALT_Bualt12G0108600 [Buddleja alternifolia]|uniref:Uncharacterized protein n=1 Tax=Buddleja alternifolia TaxID=168488 RepID=A0AAV6WQV0_9LAMI|nr:hypothetical protein BUALT_Bualt12G0108600 [Buddleja alternifolia]